MRHITKLTAVFMLLVVATAAMTGSVAAAESPVITEDSDIDDEVVLEDFNASADMTSTLEFETDTDVETDSLAVQVEAQNATHYDVDDDYANYELVEEDAEGMDIHAFDIDHDDLETVPIDANDSTDIDITINHTYTDEEETVSDETELTVTLEATGERTALFIDAEAIDDDDLGPEVEVDEYESPWYSMGDDDEGDDTYHIEDDVSVYDANTTVEVFFDDGDLADAFATDADSGAFLADRTFVTEGEDVHRAYADTTGDGTDADDDGYMLVHSSSLELALDEEFDDDEFEMHVGNHEPGDLDDIGFWDLRASYFDVQDLNFLSQDIASSDLWGALWDARAANGGFSGSIPVIGMAAGLFVMSRRRARVEQEE